MHEQSPAKSDLRVEPSIRLKDGLTKLVVVFFQALQSSYGNPDAWDTPLKEKKADQSEGLSK